MNEQIGLCCRDVLTGRLIGRLRDSLAASNGDVERLWRLELEIDDVSLLDWLAAQDSGVKMYWSDRAGSFAAAGVGTADIVTDDSHGRLADALASIDGSIAAANGRVRYYGGIAFDPDNACGEYWPGYGRYCFMVPQFELRRQDSKTTFACNIRCKSGETLESVEERLSGLTAKLAFHDGRTQSSHEPARPVILGCLNVPDKTTWCEMVSGVINDLPERHIDKIVLARKSILEMSYTVDPISLLAAIRKNSVNTYDFCFQLNDNDAFIGCSPECLYRRNAGDIYSEAIAGTVLTGDTDAERQYHQGKLVASAKERQEHDYVFDSVKSDLGGICRRVDVIEARDILSLSYVQHFRSRFAGVLKDDVSTADIIEALHPTAAVNGSPSRAALEQIRTQELFGRGWYAGPVGWIGQDASEFAVGIRSGRILNNEISLFAGAGIVRASEAQLEWNETEHKLSLFLDVINHH
ncbi:MAG: isochorismate synthase [Planctomycetes bacterium]|nr:isochorismate synthase [Planctomycetota bacterium]